jgi:hypothetical protein
VANGKQDIMLEVDIYSFQCIHGLVSRVISDLDFLELETTASKQNWPHLAHGGWCFWCRDYQL